MNKIVMYRGTTMQHAISIPNYVSLPKVEEGQPSWTEKFIFGVKKQYSDKDYLISTDKFGYNPETKTVTISLGPISTEDIQPGEYMYELAQLRIPPAGSSEQNKYYIIVPPSPFIIKPTITRSSDFST